MKLLADLQVIDDSGKSHGQYPDLRKKDAPILAKLTPGDFEALPKKHPELKATIAAILKSDFPGQHANPPVMVHPNVDAAKANEKYGERYGIDWEYEKSPSKEKTPEPKAPIKPVKPAK